MNPIAVKIGSRLRYYRLRAGLTQETLAEKAGLHHTYIGQIERGEKNMTIIALEKVLNALEVTFVELFQYMEPDSQDESIPAKCYDLISRKDKKTQEHLYRVLGELDEITKDA